MDDSKERSAGFRLPSCDTAPTFQVEKGIFPIWRFESPDQTEPTGSALRTGGIYSIGLAEYLSISSLIFLQFAVVMASAPIAFAFRLPMKQQLVAKPCPV